ncbi:precorrin-6Y C5,15-methyltransferase (decarboxylating) subunit CbiT [Parabacteroides sp. FAFU027]|uniref:precorrin-6Y C5,15-methyltransferase (decarboxylating) subunit CbiT n=1 Tax=Parabacteroides sp. FAFU027 TaxID=2922715 RepID=UPI001FB0413A|nr:precorrin-6Y C5,15-methyltransferase (decarboxylating) subunit CbiT [Parabacteroides sp. FAFU027]
MSNKYSTPGIPDDEFIRGKVPMTKEEIRTLSIAKLRLQPGDHFLDIGAGTGSVSIEAALLLPEQTVYAVEHNPEAVSLIGQNCEKFGVNNIKVIAGKAPEVLSDVPEVNKVFIGGSSGNLPAILEWIIAQVKADLTLVVNAITLETLMTAQSWFADREDFDTELSQVAVTRFEAVGKYSMMKPLTPVFILVARKK